MTVDPNNSIRCFIVRPCSLVPYRRHPFGTGQQLAAIFSYCARVFVLSVSFRTPEEQRHKDDYGQQG